MNTTRRIHQVAAVALMAATATTATAAESGFHVAISPGFANVPGDVNLVFGDLRLVSEDMQSDEDFAWSVVGGYRFNRYLSVEAGFVDLGEGSERLVNASGATAAEGEMRFSSRGPVLSVTGTLPLANWEPFLKVGMLIQDVELHLSGVAEGTPFAYDGGGDGVRAFVGAGLGYRLDDRWTVKLAVDYYEGVGVRDVTGISDIVAVSAGIVWRY